MYGAAFVTAKIEVQLKAESIHLQDSYLSPATKMSNRFHECGNGRMDRCIAFTVMLRVLQLMNCDNNGDSDSGCQDNLPESGERILYGVARTWGQ